MTTHSHFLSLLYQPKHIKGLRYYVYLVIFTSFQEEAKEAKEDSDDGKTAETEKAASEARWAVVWHLKN